VSLEAKRRLVDEVDAALVGLLAERRARVAELAREKRASGAAVVDAERERSLRARWAELARAAGLPERVALGVLEAVLVESRAHVRQVVDERDAET
jgi:chorismate mutase